MLPAQTMDDLRAMAAGYRALYLDAIGALLRIRDEGLTRDEAHSAAGELLEEHGMGNDDE